MARRWSSSAGLAKHCRPPVAGAETWAAVMESAGWRCECRGECGQPHSSDPDGRCPHTDTGWQPLHVAPRQPASTVQAAGLPASELVAVCPPCHTGRKRLTDRQRRDQAAQTQALF